MKRIWITLALTTLILTQAGAQPSNGVESEPTLTFASSQNTSRYKGLVQLYTSDPEIKKYLDVVFDEHSKLHSAKYLAESKIRSLKERAIPLEKSLKELQRERSVLLESAQKENASPKKIAKIKAEYERPERDLKEELAYVSRDLKEYSQPQPAEEPSVKLMAAKAMLAEKKVDFTLAQNWSHAMAFSSHVCVYFPVWRITHFEDPSRREFITNKQ
jgi:hypothetical protein